LGDLGGERIQQRRLNFETLKFADDIRGNVKFLPSHLTGVFEPLKNPSFFAKAHVDHGAVTWPGELDLAPDAMYDEVKQNGVWILQ